MKRETMWCAVALAMLAAPLCTNSAQAAERPTYADLRGHYAQNAVVQLVQSGLLAGGTDAYRPDEAMQWVEFDRLITRMFPRTDEGEPPLIKRKATLTRLEAVRALAAYLPATPKPASATFRDLQGVSNADQLAVARLQERGIVVGDGQGRFYPERAITRGEVAVLLERTLNALIEGASSTPFDVLDPSSPEFPEAAYTLLMENREAAGVFSVNDGENTYILVSLGVMPTTGYGIDVTDVLEGPQGRYVKTRSFAPAPGSAVGEAITYPVQLVRVKNTGRPTALVPAKLDPAQRLVLEKVKGASVLLNRQGDLNGDGVAEIAAYVQLRQPTQETAADGYLGLFSARDGRLLQRIDTTALPAIYGSNLQFGDVTGDGRSDLIFDQDTGGNGGYGSHHIKPYVQQADGSFQLLSLTQQTENLNYNDRLQVRYEASTHTYTIRATDGRAWRAAYVGPADGHNQTVQPLDNVVVEAPHLARIEAGQLVTRHYVYTGHRLSGFVHLEQTFRYERGQFVLDSFTLVPLSYQWKLTAL